MRGRVLFWSLVALTAVTVVLGLWWWLSARQENAQKVAEQSRSALNGAPKSRAPDFALPALDGKTVNLKDLRSKVVLLNFWATWCPPCKAEMPDLDALQRQYGEARDFVVLGVDMEEDAETVRQFVEQYKLSFPIVLDGDGNVTGQLFGVRGLPMTFIIDREGMIRDAWNGQIAPEAMVARLERVW